MVSPPSSMSNPDTSSAHSSSPPHPMTPASRRHSDGGAGNSPTTPATGYPSTTHKHLQSLFDAQTSDLDLTPYEKKVIAYLRAKTARPLHHPTEDLPSPQQLLEQQEFKRYLRFQEETTEEKDKFYFQSQEGHPSTIHNHPQSPYDIQTSALNHPPHEKNAIPKLTAKGASSLPYPIKDRPSPQQLLEQQEAKWHQRFQDHANEFEDKYFRQSLGCQAELYRCSDAWYERWEKKTQRIIEQSVEISAVLSGKTEIMRLKEIFNVRGALEYMVHYAKLIKKIGTDCPPGIQAGLNELAKAPEFTKALHDEVASHGLGLTAVTSCIALVYAKVFQHARGNDYIITLYKGDYTANEGAVLAAFLRMQSEWPYGLEWREEMGKGRTKR
ncbi:hypothetical protein B9Z19DRAFT_1190263 [Tuber borchii]|uniref:Uncharacterized protein n=1 Tax=Tuber borchii TaxID=42251 RepID=A0A2T7A4B7_TUBBO|nr:hypothetical protein B9Z19DRAFT_1190263 [Tuber borchii]